MSANTYNLQVKIIKKMEGIIMMRVKKQMALLLSMVMVAGTAMGCSGKQEKNETTSPAPDKVVEKVEEKEEKETAIGFERNEKGYPDLKGETFTIWFPMTGENAQTTTDLGDYVVLKELEEKFNCNLEFIHPPLGQEPDNFAIMMADKTLPDMIFGAAIHKHYPGKEEMAYNDGVLYDYTSLINEENTPNFYGMMQDDAFFAKAVTDDAGRIIRLGSKIQGSEEADLTYAGPMIRKDFLEETGLDLPTTIDEWTAVLTGMKANGVEFPLGLHAHSISGETFGNIFSSAYGVDAKKYYKKDDGTVAFAPYEDDFKDYLTTLNSWYEQGFINPDFMTQSEDDIMSLFASDRVGSALTHLYTYGATYYLTTETEDESKALIPVQIPVLNKGDSLGNFRSEGRGLADHKYITADAKNPEACMAFLDALYLPEIDRMLAYGVEGVAYEMVDGDPVAIMIPEGAPKEDFLSKAPQQWATTDDTDLDYILTRKYNKGSQPDALKLWKQNGTSNLVSSFILLNEDEAAAISQYSADIDTYVEEMILKFVTGNESLDNFDDFQANLEQLHIDELIAVYQDAEDRFAAR